VQGENLSFRSAVLSREESAFAGQSRFLTGKGRLFGMKKLFASSYEVLGQKPHPFTY
jgi:hypothetical protein